MRARPNGPYRGAGRRRCARSPRRGARGSPRHDARAAPRPQLVPWSRPVAYPGVYYLDFLRQGHELLAPPTYLEIGVRNGDSLALAHSASVGIDPAYRLRATPPPNTKLFRQTSDDYFERPDALVTLGGRPVAFSFIDGMHLAEFALRDFVNVERHAHWTGVVVFDDILPHDVEMAARDRQTRAWTGDVYKLLAVFAEHRPDLVCLRIGTDPTGLLMVLGLDPDSRVLADRLDAITRSLVTPDPQSVPADVLERRGVIEPEAMLAASFWSVLRDGRERGLSREEGLPAVRAAIARDFPQHGAAGPTG